MILPTEKYSFTLLTACFCGGADSQTQTAPAEMRVPSIRGQVRAWHRVMEGEDAVNRIWGSTVGEAGASRVALILDASIRPRQAQPKPNILPHKGQGPRPALAAGQSFTLTLQRLIACAPSDWTAAQNAVKLWLLIGGLGLRANRAAGSVWPIGNWVPQTSIQLGETLRKLRFPWAVQLVDTPSGTQSDELRRLASDTVKGQPHFFGEIKPRTPSPTRFKVIELGGQPRLLVTARPPVDLMAVRAALSGPNKAGQYLWQPL
jgi:CRISPR/Cas system CMR-associated protein Cmr1 (group 7 of RAMP superfamily)